MPSRVLASANPTPRTYAELRRSVENTLLAGQQRIEQARVRTYWETGRLIREHLLLNAARAEYGAQVIPRLGRDLKVAERTLYQCVQFAEYFPILRTCAELSWGHYRLFCQIEDAATRRGLLQETRKRGWKCLELETRVRALNLAANEDTGTKLLAAPASKLLVPKRGTVGVHRLVPRGERLAVDLGFKIYRPLDGREAAGMQDGAFVRLDAEGMLEPATDATKADLFTYQAKIRRVIDGDTLVIEVVLLPRCFVEQKLRLRGLDCPEIATPEGKAAKRFVETLLTRTTVVTITTFKPDKYDRYLADVFLQQAGGEDLFLNNALLENGHALRKDEWEFRDWEKDGLK